MELRTSIAERSSRGRISVLAGVRYERDEEQRDAVVGSAAFQRRLAINGVLKLPRSQTPFDLQRERNDAPQWAPALPGIQIPRAQISQQTASAKYLDSFTRMTGRSLE